MLKGSCLCGGVAERVAQPTVLLRLGCLDTAVGERPQIHIWRSQGASWYDPNKKVEEIPEGLT